MSITICKLNKSFWTNIREYIPHRTQTTLGGELAFHLRICSHKGIANFVNLIIQNVYNIIIFFSKYTMKLYNYISERT